MKISLNTEFVTRNGPDDPPYDGGIDDLLDLEFEHRPLAALAVSQMAFERRYPILSAHLGGWV